MSKLNKPRTWVVITAILAVAVYRLRCQERIWWCACGQVKPWAGDIWSPHNSQHLFDPYSFTHVLHGVLLCWLIVWILPRLPLMWQFTVASAAEVLWEVFENSQFIIQRYRETTIGMGYEGDSIINSMGDILCCAMGFFLARYLGLWRSLTLFVLIEIGLLFVIRDNLTLNLLMLICPVDAIKTWQMAR